MNVKSDISDGQSESNKEVQSVSNVEFENANISEDTIQLGFSCNRVVIMS